VADWLPIIIATVVTVAVAGLGAALTTLDDWYRNLRKPSWQPPDWLFGPAWTLIFTLTATAGVKAWNVAPNNSGRILIIGAFALNGILNILWSAIFFRMRRPDWAVWEVALLWLSVLALVIVVARFSGSAAWLLVPYLIWVAFAAFLNFTVVKLNSPFGIRRP
jgi:translocator protein